jgi:hypothetical protein
MLTEELDGHCGTFHPLDENLPRNLRKADINETRVFVEEDGNLRLSAPGEAYLASVIKELTRRPSNLAARETICPPAVGT